MKKILNFLFVRRTETEDKWWHRLFTVLLLGSGAVIFITAMCLNIQSSNHSWISYKPTFSLEQNYKTVGGKELPCSIKMFAFEVTHTEPLRNSDGIKCDGIIISDFDSRRFAKLYHEEYDRLRTGFGLDKYNFTNCQSIKDVACVDKEISDMNSDPASQKFNEALKNIARIKVERNFDYGLMLNDFYLWVIIPTLVFVFWIIFWSSVIYRSILYIIFGKKKYHE